MKSKGIDKFDLKIPTLGECTIESPLKCLLQGKQMQCLLESEQLDVHFVKDCQKIFFNILTKEGQDLYDPPLLELAGPREKIFFNPVRTKAAIVTCGGICPGINDVIRAIVMTLHYRYGVQEILGIKYGYEGFIKEYGHEPLSLTPDRVSKIHKSGGTILGTSRGDQDSGKIVDFLLDNQINILFVIGGDGTQRGALEIASAASKRKANISVIGVPKTIDNDIMYMDQTFGFSTAVSEAVKTIDIAKTEAISQMNGIGLVKLMGRHSGFITCFAAVAMGGANFVLIPEVPFDLEGEKGFLKALQKRIERRGHAVVIVSEGAGQKFFEKSTEVDASGNVRLKDIGLYLKEKINDYFKEIGTLINLKYVDPSYSIRAIGANAVDSMLCQRLGQNAVHAAMSGRTEVVVGMLHHKYVHLPMRMIASGRRQVDPNSDLWLSVLEATGQPPRMCSPS